MKLQVVLLDRQRTYCSVVHENEHIPYGRRLVTLELTPEQCAALVPREVGFFDGVMRNEDLGEVWLEDWP